LFLIFDLILIYFDLISFDLILNRYKKKDEDFEKDIEIT